LTEFVYNETNDGMHKKFVNFNLEKLKTNNPIEAYDCYGYDKDGVIDAINNCDVHKARIFYNFASNFMPNNLIELLEYEINKPKVQYLV
jgi:hypothetical protein